MHTETGELSRWHAAPHHCRSCGLGHHTRQQVSQLPF
jgi:hypothetical protein